MGGRRAVVIDSTDDEAEKHSRTTPCLNEEDVLLPVSPKIHPDNWPCFVLNDVVVYGKDGKTPASLLHAELEGPLVIRGKLEVDKEFRHLLKIHKPRNFEIRVNDVKGFSMGIGPVCLWAGGKSGWFEIRPAPSYQLIFDKMTEGVTLYYFLIDFYESRRGKKTPEANGIFREYRKEFDKSMTIDEVIRRCEEHATFLLSQMRKPQEPVGWDHTKFYLWLTGQCSDINDRYTKKTQPKDAPPPVMATEQDHVVGSRRTATLRGGPLPEKITQGYSSTEIVIQVMNQLHLSKKLPRQKINIRRLGAILFERYDIFSEALAQEFLRAHAKEIFTTLDRGDWAISPLYTELEIILNQPTRKKSSFWRAAKQLELIPRGHDDAGLSSSSVTIYGLGRRRKRSSEISQQEIAASIEHLETSQSDINARKIAGRGKVDQSAGEKALPTRPRSSRTRSKSSPVESSHSMSRRSRGSEKDDEIRVAPLGEGFRRRRSSRSGKIAALRLASSPATKDQITSMSSDDEPEETRSRKRPRLSDSPTHDESEITQSSTDFTPYMDPVDYGDDAAEQLKEELIMVSQPIPSTSPQGPNGLWRCHREGCSYLVRSADKPDGRAKVHKHFLEHADEIAARENLVLEESRPYLQVSHLLEKLRGLGEAARLAEERRIGGRVVPQPIKRRLVV